MTLLGLLFLDACLFLLMLGICLAIGLYVGRWSNRHNISDMAGLSITLLLCFPFILGVWFLTMRIMDKAGW